MKLINLRRQAIQYPVSENIISSLPKIKAMAKQIKAMNLKKGRIVLCCRGSSGSIIAGIINTMIPKAIINHVKKEGERSHHDGFCYDITDKLIIVDDFIDTGVTIRKIYDSILWNHYEFNGIEAIVIGGTFHCPTRIIKEINPKTFVYSIKTFIYTPSKRKEIEELRKCK